MGISSLLLALPVPSLKGISKFAFSIGFLLSLFPGIPMLIQKANVAVSAPLYLVAALGSAAVLFISIMLPATQDIEGIWKMSAPFWVLCILSGTALFTQMILSFTEPTAMGRLRNLAILMMIVGNGLSFIFDSFASTIIGSSIFLLGGFITMVVTLRNSVIL